MRDYQKLKEFFEVAYRTGSDVWTNSSTKNRRFSFMEKLPPNALILDVGSGRGFFAKKLVESGYRVVGLDFEENIVKKANENIKEWGMEGKLKFVEGSVLDIPFTDSSFDGVCDFGLLENLYKEDWPQYTNEINRVLKPGGFYLNVSLSRETQQFLDFKPKGSSISDFNKYDVSYHFFDKEEIKKIFEQNLIPLKQEVEFVEKPSQLAFLETLFQKKI